MNCSKRHLQYFSSTLFFLLIASLSFGQSNPTKTNEHSSITLKTFRGLFPQYPVAIANEIHGGLHVVQTVDQLHGLDNAGDLKLDPHVLQKGMLVFLPDPNPGSDLTYSMYYIYVGTVTDGVGSNGLGTNLDPNGVNLDNWQPFTDLFPDPVEIIPEAVTVIWNCTSNYTITSDKGVVDVDGDTNTSNSSSEISSPNAGDHLILMPGESDDSSNKTKPIAVYVWYGEWKLISLGTQVIQNTTWSISGGNLYTDVNHSTLVTRNFNEGDIIKLGDYSYVYDGDSNSWLQITNETEDDLDQVIEVKLQNGSTSDEVDLSLDPAGNGYLASAYSEGDIIKLIDANGIYVTYAATDADRSSTAADGWLEIARGIQPKGNNIEFPVYYGDYTGTPTFTSASANAISLDAFRSQINTNASNGLSLTGANTGVAIEYPAAWGNLSYSISDSGNTFELTNGVNITVVEKTIGGVTVDYKQVTIPCGTSTIIVN